MIYAPGDSYYKEFATSYGGVAMDASPSPTATANRNGVDDPGFALTVQKIDTGRYKVTGTVPSSYTTANIVNVTVVATINSAGPKKQTIDTFYVLIPITTPVSLPVGGVTGTVASPAVVTRDLFVTQYSAQSFAWTLSDIAGNPINLSGKTVRFRVADRLEVVQISYDSGTANLSVAGTGNNIVTLTFATADTQLERQLTYTLWNVTDNLPLSAGRCIISAAVTPN